jgi:hypothetical protein
MKNSITDTHSDNVFDLFSSKSLTTLDCEQIIRLSPEYDGLCMLYSNVRPHTEKLYSMKILCWALLANGEVTGMVPWLDKLLPCTDLKDPCHGEWEGYYDPVTEDVFYEAPLHKQLALENACGYFDGDSFNNDQAVLQEIPDTIGTHAMLDSANQHSLILTEVLSWQLLSDGSLQAMLVDENKVTSTPVLPGDDSLYPATENPGFRYFFQYHIANQIKSEDPEAMAAIALLFHH